VNSTVIIVTPLNNQFKLELRNRFEVLKTPDLTREEFDKDSADQEWSTLKETMLEVAQKTENGTQVTEA